MATSSEMIALVNMIGRVGKQLERIADAMERQNPPQKSPSTSAAPLGVPRDDEEPNINSVGF
jgi:hypothetical protein